MPQHAWTPCVASNAQACMFAFLSCEVGLVLYLVRRRCTALSRKRTKRQKDWRTFPNHTLQVVTGPS